MASFLASFTGMDLPDWAWWVVLLAGSGTGIAKTAVPGGGILVVAALALAVPSRMSVGILLPILLFGDLFALWRFRKYADRRRLLLLFPPALLGLGAGYAILGRVNDAQLRPVIGAVVLSMAALQQLSRAIKKKREGNGADCQGKAGPAATLVFGFFSGMGTGMANSSGPVLSLYLLMAELPKVQFIATSAWFFFAMNLLKVPLFMGLGLLSAASLRVSLLMVPSVAAGAVLGYWMVPRISQERFNQLVFLLALAAAIRLLV